METELFQDGGQIKKEKDIYHHGPKDIPFRSYATFDHYHLPDPTSSLWRIESGSCAEGNPGPIEDDYINVFPDLLCQLSYCAH
jgi:hypothetical protein